MNGAGWHRINVRDGKRFTTKEAYLDPARGRSNLTIEFGAHATKVLFDGERANGVGYLQGAGITVRTRAARYVCEGALESPHLLLLSGIGPEAHLREHGVDVVASLPGVGENFHNHVLTGVIRECSRGPAAEPEPLRGGALPQSSSGSGNDGPTCRSRSSTSPSTSSSARGTRTRSASCPASSARLARLVRRERRPAREAGGEPELPRRPVRPRAARRGRRARPRALRDRRLLRLGRATSSCPARTCPT